MPKTVPPKEIDVPGVGKFTANAVPDPFDGRDFEYRSRLEPLPQTLDQRANKTPPTILHQQGESCTGHAVAAVVNTILAQINPGRRATRVSPYMLYYFARRYDEFPGEEDIGSSLRGAFKGWFHHGVAPENRWLKDKPGDLDDEKFVKICREVPLGAFYRVNPYRLDDVQSAISELHGIAVSATIHEGWYAPEPFKMGRETIYVISRPTSPTDPAGHAFALVGYNEVGFLVQNSWGKDWGKGGFATLPYEDWLQSAYDAWVARPGVPRTPLASGWSLSRVATGREMATAPAPDLRRLRAHVVNIGNNGRLSQHGRFDSSPEQIRRAFEHMNRWHEFWLDNQKVTKRHIVFFVHGGLVDEQAGLEIAQKHLNWWLNNGVYPLTFVWQSGPVETLVSELTDLTQRFLPFGGLGFDLQEQFDRWVEKFSRSKLRWLWTEMKENARAASADADGNEAPGGTLTVQILKEYVATHGADNVVVHLVAHSAGAIFLAALLQQLAANDIAIETMSFLAPALRVDDFAGDVLPRLGQDKTVARFATFAMTDDREADDTVGRNGLTVYNKSLLYLVSRGLERIDANGDGRRAFEVPLIGMARFFDCPLNGDGGPTLKEAIQAAGGEAIFSPTFTPAVSRSDSNEHGEFDDDPLTMTSVLMRMLGAADPATIQEYQPHMPLAEEPSPAAQPPDAAAPAPPRAGAGPADAEAAAEVSPPFGVPISDTPPPQTQQPQAPKQPRDLLLEVAVAPPSGKPIVDVLESVGYTRVETPAAKNGQPGAPRSRK